MRSDVSLSKNCKTLLIKNIFILFLSVIAFDNMCISNETQFERLHSLLMSKFYKYKKFRNNIYIYIFMFN